MIKRRAYTKEFKIEAVELADKIDNSPRAERDLGIPHGQIYKWRKELEDEGEPKKAFPGKGNLRDAKMKALKRRLDRLEGERDSKKSDSCLQHCSDRAASALRYPVIDEFRG